MFKNCTFNINISPDDKHQQEQVDSYVKLDGYSYLHPFYDDVDSLLKELHLIEGADYCWKDNDQDGSCELWVLPSLLGKIYHAIHSSAGASSTQDVHLENLPYEELGDRIYDLIHEYKSLRLEYFSGAISIYKVNQNAN